MTPKIKRIASRVALCLVLVAGAGLLAGEADAARKCRVQHCFDFLGVPICYYDSGWIDC